MRTAGKGPPMTSTSPRVADRYRLVGELGRGGMGVVWEAFDELLHRSVAVKEVRFPPELPAEDRARLAGRTLQEARAVAAVDTQAAVRVYDIVEQDGRPWLVMELLRGTTLAAEIATRGPLPEAEVARTGLAVLEALEAAHAAGVLHRDVKPSNVLLADDGRVALTDFGIATIEGDGGDATTGVVLGSPAYVAPERVAGQRPTAASDLWALGATLWTALEGHPPYEAPTALAVMNAVATADAPPCTRGSAALTALVADLLSRDPARRPAAGTVREVLTRSVEEPEAVPPPPAPTRVLDDHFDRTTVLEQGALEQGVLEQGVLEQGSPAASPPPPLQTPVSRLVSRPVPGPLPEPARRGLRPALVAAALVVVVLAAGLGVLLSRTGGDPAAPTAGSTASPASSTRPSAATTARATTAPSATTATTATDAGAGLQQAVGDGWAVSVPAGWQRQVTDAGTRWTDPAGGRYVLVATRDPAGPSAVGAWRDQEKSMRARHPDYQRVRLETIDQPGASDAADWEFRYSDGGASLHALDRAWVVDGVGYAVFVQSHDDQWEASQPLFDRVLASFRAT